MESPKATQPTGYEVSRAGLLNEGVKALILANGGGAVALLAFLQSIWGKDYRLTQLILVGLGLMLHGLIYAALIPFFRFIHSLQVDPNRALSAVDTASGKTWAWSLRNTCVITSFASFILACALLIVGGLFWIKPSPTPPEKEAIAAPELVALARDVSEIRRRLQTPAAAAGAKPAALPVAGDLPIPGKIDFGGVGSMLLWSGLLIAAAGLGLALIGKASTRPVGIALATVGTLASVSGGLVKELKIDSIFTVEKLTLLELVREQVPLGPKRLGSVANFKLGSAEEVAAFDADREYEKIAEHWIENRKAGRDGILLVIGSTDRVPLRKVSQTRFEANVGLARARAETVKTRVIEAVRRKQPPKLELAPTDEQVLVLVSGPQQTPAQVADGYPSGFPKDRSVDVWAFWSGK